MAELFVTVTRVVAPPVAGATTVTFDAVIIPDEFGSNARVRP